MITGFSPQDRGQAESVAIHTVASQEAKDLIFARKIMSIVLERTKTEHDAAAGARGPENQADSGKIPKDHNEIARMVGGEINPQRKGALS